jgi:hypothetical protein|nr:MAG TPA: hypothetical protein [Crassvirales sp.]
METKEIKIQVPEGYEIDKENSTFECIKFKKVHEVYTWDDIKHIKGVFISLDSSLRPLESVKDEMDKNTFHSERYAKAALALAQISQLMPYYGGEITNKEWLNERPKYSIIMIGHEVCVTDTWKTRYPISFHTAEDRNKFLSFLENVQLVKDFYMVD